MKKREPSHPYPELEALAKAAGGKCLEQFNTLLVLSASHELSEIRGRAIDKIGVALQNATAAVAEALGTVALGTKESVVARKPADVSNITGLERQVYVLRSIYRDTGSHFDQRVGIGKATRDEICRELGITPNVLRGIMTRISGKNRPKFVAQLDVFSKNPIVTGAELGKLYGVPPNLLYNEVNALENKKSTKKKPARKSAKKK